MKMKALVVYGSRYGTAAEIAQEIARVIEEEGVEVDLIEDKKIKKPDPTPYDLIVVGSGIKMGKWTKNSIKFLKDNKKALKDKKVALFVSCSAANEEKSREMGLKNYLQKVAADNLEVEPVDMGLFGSKYDPNAKQGMMYKMTMKFWKKDLEDKGFDTSKPYDFRDWDSIREWAQKLVKL
jgi:menaquinone-dependent protoporphyrinogen oxidase